MPPAFSVTSTRRLLAIRITSILASARLRSSDRQLCALKHRLFHFVGREVALRTGALVSIADSGTPCSTRKVFTRATLALGEYLVERRVPRWSHDLPASMRVWLSSTVLYEVGRQPDQRLLLTRHNPPVGSFAVG